jgi:hypothetical protein
MNKRFEHILYERVESSDGAMFCHIIKDKVTGVLYLASYNASGISGLTVMVDKDGKPLTG